MKTVIVTDQNQTWFEIADATVLTARRYLAEPESGNEGAVRVLNLCRTGRYQGRGYYVYRPCGSGTAPRCGHPVAVPPSGR